MKIKLIYIILVLFTSITLLGQTNDNPGSYMTFFSETVNDFKGETWHYLKAITRGKGAKKVENKRKELINKVSSIKTNISAANAYNGDQSLKNAYIEYLSIYHTVLTEDFEKIVNLEEIAEQSYDLMEAYLLAKEKANEKLDEASEKLMKVENEFAKKYNVNLVSGKEDKTSQKIKKAAEALTYYNEIYLIFFKCYKQEAYVLDATNKGDVNGAQQNKTTLLSFAEEGLEKLKALKNYENDSKLKNAGIKILNFYKKEANESFTSMIDFYMKKDNFEKIKKSFDSKKPKDRTKEDIDKFNKAVNEYNTAIPSYNSVNDKTNKERSAQLEEWNKKVEEFFDSHSK